VTPGQASAATPLLTGAEERLEQAAGAPLARLPEAEARQVLVAQTARFTADFMRWMEGRACDGLNYQRLSLLQSLHCSGPAIMRDLGARLGLSPRNMTVVVDGLEEAGLVARRPHPTDRRATLVELSADGAAEAERELGPRLNAMAELFASLAPPEREQFSAILTRLTEAMRAGEERC
jgi:DNA-binding MarR family transcriptional regulator